LNTFHQPAAFRQPTAEDGSALFELIRSCPPLDTNSMYCNLLQYSHFAETAMLAEQDGKLVGSVTGYRLPERPNTLFVWQVAVHPSARGTGLARRMLGALLERPQHRNIDCVETTITEDNQASWRTFKRLAEQFDAPYETQPGFERDRHFDGQHSSEILMKIGPLKRTAQ